MTGSKSQRRFLPPPPPPPPPPPATAVSTSPATSTLPPLTKPKTGYWPVVHACPHKDHLMDVERRLAQKRLVELAKMGEVCQQITAEQKAIVVAVHGPCSSSSCADVLVQQNIEKTVDHGESNSSGPSPANCVSPGGDRPLPATSHLYQVSVSAKVANLKRQRLFEARMAVLKVKSQAKSRRPSNGGGPALQSAPVLTKKQRKKLKQKNNKKKKKKQNGSGNCPELENSSSSSSSSSFDSSFSSSSTSKDEDDENDDKVNILKSTITTCSSSSEPQIIRKATKSDQKTTTATTTPSAPQPKRTALKRVNTHSEHELPNVPPRKVLKKNSEKDEKIDALQPKVSRPLSLPPPSTEPSNEKSVTRGRTDPDEIRASTLLPLRRPEKLASRSSPQPVSGFFCPAPGCTCRLFTVFEYYEHLAERHQSKLACPVEGCLQLFEGFSLAALKAHDRQAHSNDSGQPVSSASMLHRRLEHHLREGQWWCRKGCGYMSTSRAAWRAHEGRRCGGGGGDGGGDDHLLEELHRIECRPLGVDGH